MINIDKNYDVVILTHKPNDDLVLSLEKITSQTLLPNKIIIYNTNEKEFYTNIISRIKFNNIIHKNSNIEVHHISEFDFDHGKARNDASIFCNSKYILFMTDDAIPYDEYMCDRMIESFNKYESEVSKVATVYARQVPKSNAKLKERYVREFNYPDYDIIKEKPKAKSLGIKNYFCSNVCAMYDREIFNDLGKFEENIILNEDTFYVYNAINKGFRVVYCSNALVIHSHNLSYKQQFSRNFDIGVSQAEKEFIFRNIKSSSEGRKLLIFVLKKLISTFHIIICFDFIIECIFRYCGFKKGLSFKKLTIDNCIKYSNNKNYFIKMKNNTNV